MDQFNKQVFADRVEDMVQTFLREALDKILSEEALDEAYWDFVALRRLGDATASKPSECEAQAFKAALRGVKLSALPEEPECKQCNDTGFMSDPAGQFGTWPCQHCKKL